MFEIVPFTLAIFVVFIIDYKWWQIDFKKAEKGMEAHEHYHLGLELLIVSVIVGAFNDILSSFIAGMGVSFIVAEIAQRIEIYNKKIIVGHPMAIGSSHFKASSIIGIVLVITLCIVYGYFYLVNLFG